MAATFKDVRVEVAVARECNSVQWFKGVSEKMRIIKKEGGTV